MRKFSSYGPIDKEINYYAPREELIQQACDQLTGENRGKGGHYFTIWAPRQAGKTWVLQQAVFQLRSEGEFEVGIFTLEALKEVQEESEAADEFVKQLSIAFRKDFPSLTKIKEIPNLFTKEHFKKPVVLVIDEFDALEEHLINRFASIFRTMYTSRTNEMDRVSSEKTYLLHGLALIGIRSVLGIENQKGSPFNVQRSMKIPNLTFEEVDGLFKWYERESGQKVEQEVVDCLFYECQGQPGLTCWFGELLTETYQEEVTDSIDYAHWMKIYSRASHILPNNNILNIISKANQPEYLPLVLELFQTAEKVEFSFEDPHLNYLYLNGVIDYEIERKEYVEKYFAKFSSPFVQKRLFNRYSKNLFPIKDNLVEPFESLDDAITDTDLYIRPILSRYQKYLRKNSHWLFKNAPRRRDLKLFESVYHFNAYAYLYYFLSPKKGIVHPEFPTGNGKIDILIQYQQKKYGIELKSYVDQGHYRQAITQAAAYGKQLGLSEITLLFFVEQIDEQNRERLEKDVVDPDTGVKVEIVFIETADAA